MLISAVLTANAKAGAINDLRQKVLTHVRSQADNSPGVFTLTVPTGGGKTLTSLAFALDHAVRHGLARVIYVIPYMSIIEQTAAVFRKALRDGDDDSADFVVEHHSTFDEESIGNREAKEKLRLAMENWTLRSSSQRRCSSSRACSPTGPRAAENYTISRTA